MFIQEFENIKNKNINFIIENAELFGKIETIAKINKCQHNSFSGDVILIGTISLKDIKDIFRFKTQEYVDKITCLTGKNLSFEQNLTRNDNILLRSIEHVKYFDECTCNYLTIGVEYVQYLAFKLFGSRRAFNIIENRDEIINDIQYNFSKSFEEYFIQNSNNSCIKIRNITKKLMETILKLDKNRLNINGISLGSITEIEACKKYQGIPFAIGDTLVMKYSIIDNNNFNKYNCMGNNNIRGYIIKLIVIEDDCIDNTNNECIDTDINEKNTTTVIIDL